MLHILVFLKQNIGSLRFAALTCLVITLRAKEAPRELCEGIEADVQTPLDMSAVLSTFRRFHAQYHSNVAVFLYLFDLHVAARQSNDEQVDRVVSIVMRSVRNLYDIEDRMIRNYSTSLYKRREDIGADRISTHSHILQRISEDVAL